MSRFAAFFLAAARRRPTKPLQARCTCKAALAQTPLRRRCRRRSTLRRAFARAPPEQTNVLTIAEGGRQYRRRASKSLCSGLLIGTKHFSVVCDPSWWYLATNALLNRLESCNFNILRTLTLWTYEASSFFRGIPSSIRPLGTVDSPTNTHDSVTGVSWQETHGIS